jgi:hypothetical protein
VTIAGAGDGGGTLTWEQTHRHDLDCTRSARSRFTSAPNCAPRRVTT